MRYEERISFFVPIAARHWKSIERTIKMKANRMWIKQTTILFAMVACALAGFADDSNQTVAATSYTSVPNTDMPRRRMLLGAGNANRKAYTYYGSSSSNSGNTNTTRIFVDDPPDIVVDSVKIIDYVFFHLVFSGDPPQ